MQSNLPYMLPGLVSELPRYPNQSPPIILKDTPLPTSIVATARTPRPRSETRHRGVSFPGEFQGSSQALLALSQKCVFSGHVSLLCSSIVIDKSPRTYPGAGWTRRLEACRRPSRGMPRWKPCANTPRYRQYQRERLRYVHPSGQGHRRRSSVNSFQIMPC